MNTLRYTLRTSDHLTRVIVGQWVTRHLIYEWNAEIKSSEIWQTTRPIPGAESSFTHTTESRQSAWCSLHPL